VKIKLDLHVHSYYSRDGFSSIEEIVDRVTRQGLDGFALTDHDTLEGLKEARETARGLVFVPALEVSAKGAHILALDPVGPIPVNLSIAETVDHIHDQGAVAVLAHPYGLPKSWVRIKEARTAHFDAIEVANSAQFPYSIICKMNQGLADRLGLPITGGSDSHIPETVGRAFTLVEADSSEVCDVLKAIRLGRTSVGGSYTRLSEWLCKNIKKKKNFGMV